MPAIADLKRTYFVTALALSEEEARLMSINDLEFLFFSGVPGGGGGGGVPDDGSVTNVKVAVGAAINLDKTADSATRLAMAAAERTKLSGVATGATANSADATLLARANHTGSQAQSTITNLTTDLAAKAPLASPAFTGTPTGITKTHVGLANVDNTADSAKPVSTAQQTALNLKANLASPTFTGTVGGITAAMVGLGNVNNTADSAKPVSTAQQTALDGKADTTHSHAIADLPADSVVSTTSSTTRPTARTDIKVIWCGADPTTNALSNDIWLG